MAKRIFRTMAISGVMAVLLTALLIVPALYRVYEARISNELRLEADYIAHALVMTDDMPAYLSEISSANRITLVAADGTVLYDSAAEPSVMENHSLRPEIAQAMAEGSGESMRRSDTISDTTINYAVRMESGDVLRIASARSSVLGVFLDVMPIICAMLLAVVFIAFMIARLSAKFIVAPINNLDLDAPLENDAYDELAPLLVRMDRQNDQIRRHVKALEQARTELAAIMENMSEGMILLDDRDDVLSMNGSAAGIFGVRSEGHTGRSVSYVERDPELRRLVNNAKSGLCGDMLVKRNGSIYRIFVSPVTRDGEIHGTVLLILDVTEHFAAEESRREFTANVSHELKTPLTSISGYAEIIRDGIAQQEDIPNFAGRICSEAGRLVALVNDILELSRLDEKQVMEEKTDINVGALMRTLAEDLQPQADKKNICIDVSGTDAMISGHPMLVREMFFNLVDNAVRYTPDGGRVELGVRCEDNAVVCWVADNGIGIPAAHQARVFERFYRVDKSHSRATGGTGLGLAIVKHVAEIHGAGLRLDSAEGQGTKVTVTFTE